MVEVCDNLLCCGSKRHGVFAQSGQMSKLTLLALINTRVRLVWSLKLTHLARGSRLPSLIDTIAQGSIDLWNSDNPWAMRHVDRWATWTSHGVLLDQCDGIHWGKKPRTTNPPHLSVSWSPLLFIVASQCCTSSAWQAIHVLYLDLAICAGFCMRSSPTHTTFCDFTPAPHGQETLPGLDSRRGTGLSIMGRAPSPFNVAGEGSEILDRAQTQNERISADQIPASGERHRTAPPADVQDAIAAQTSDLQETGPADAKFWSSPISVSTSTPSEHRSDGPAPLRMRMMRPPASTRVAPRQNHGQTARSTQGPKSTVQSPAKCAHRRGFETLWVRKGPRDRPGDEKNNGMPSRSLNAPSKIDLLWRLTYHVFGRTRQ
ncbi:uncharacterized protein AKAW2_50294S [Aspergillus luchuensis]|uniref:Uncharacterized protein n=1 Tax=Aspergillus kawachii TaxID=1069201 RepID=A0A7R7WBL4_ASPKA|nr:uncharacterized protein AKAW2_50294S [Aspergillus luchuensis]BCR99952.1 hypothetical protein AKAW2_50294S [Aspergillus luchuensis]